MNPKKLTVKNVIKDVVKKFGTIALICAVVVSVFFVPSQPESAFAAREKAELNVYYLGNGITPDFNNAKKNVELDKLTSAAIGDIIWVGVAVDKLDRLGQPDGAIVGGFIREEGIINMEIGFDYNSKYIHPVIIEDSGEIELANDVNLIGEIGKNNLINDEQSTDKKWSNRSYEVGPSTVSGTYDDEELMKAEFIPPATGDWEMLQTRIKGNDGITIAQPRLKEAEQEQYLLVASFRLINFPEETAPGVDKEPPIRLARSPGRLGFISKKTLFGGASYLQAAYWEKDEKSNAGGNLKNMFEFSGDLDFFGGGAADTGAEIGAISMTRYFDAPTDPSEEKQETVAAYMDKNAPADPAAYDNYNNAAPAAPVKEEGGASTHILDEAYTSPAKEYSPKITNYYADIKHDTKKLELTFDGLDSAPVIKINTTPYGGAVDESGSTAFDGKKKYKIEIDPAAVLTALAPDALAADEGFKNKVEVVVGSGSKTRTYTIHLRRLLKPEIKLNYGNSPYGEIMRMGELTEPDKWDTDKIEQAKQEFNKKNTYANGFVPTRVQPVVDAKYSFATRAWVDIKNVANITPDEAAKIADPKINLDRDPYALFAYNGKTFKDSGFTATDSFGQAISELDCKVEYKRVGSSNYMGMQSDKATSEMYNEKHVAAGSEVTKLTYKYTGGNGRFVVPNVYSMEYSFTDKNTNELIRVVRNLIIVSLLGDTDLNGAIGTNDRNFIASYVLNGEMPEKEKYDENSLRIYLFRTAATVTTSNQIGSNARNPINVLVSKGQTLSQQMYIDID